MLVHRLKATTKRASRAPNLRAALLRVLRLLQANGLAEVRYDSLVRHLSEALVTGNETLEDLLAELVNDGRIAIRAREDDPGVRRVVFLTDDVLGRDDMLHLTRSMET